MASQFATPRIPRVKACPEEGGPQTTEPASNLQICFHFPSGCPCSSYSHSPITAPGFSDFHFQYVHFKSSYLHLPLPLSSTLDNQSGCSSGWYLDYLIWEESVTSVCVKRGSGQTGGQTTDCRAHTNCHQRPILFSSLVFYLGAWASSTLGWQSHRWKEWGPLMLSQDTAAYLTTLLDSGSMRTQAVQLQGSLCSGAFGEVGTFIMHHLYPIKYFCSNWIYLCELIFSPLISPYSPYSWTGDIFLTCDYFTHI